MQLLVDQSVAVVERELPQPELKLGELPKMRRLART
jgi:hypothetical protein